ncbi:Adhesion defective protein [Schizosaccharomyces pombe]|uniref:Adhesion defective protein 1 n=1 Tax=Schizosaccharomyces pombe (strain 972 / ATCC 24843) TaxID=284812 RepID=ADN1_SCHPO|nr:putative transcriptional regulator adn1 [Schizosaccharomyces pombe]O74364.1 RecName: Full=Adhesion defective protein 1 [Schizosaccharomyces pombe 972h-]CAA20316.1 adhesion defective protein, predicted transcriptional regulator (predicted) [Schizosaccharomyces pombe]|eukprot:NP_595528.1 putative transcriptional regulator adn1 [Schizosaccharomyces pombe]
MVANYASMMYHNGSNILGYGVLRLLQYNEQLMSGWESTMKDDIGYWRRFVHDFYTEKGTFRYNIDYKDSPNQEPKLFELSYAALPRFLYLSYCGKLKKMSFLLGNTKEFAIPNNGYFVESSRASILYQYQGGVQVIVSGHLRAHFFRAPLLKLDSLEFSAVGHSEYLLRELMTNASLALSQSRPPQNQIQHDGVKSEDPSSESVNINSSSSLLPDSPVNEYGLEPHIMRFMEITETISGMRDLIAFTLAQRSGPTSALHKFATALQQQHQMQKSTSSNIPYANPAPSGFNGSPRNGDVASLASNYRYAKQPPTMPANAISQANRLLDQNNIPNMDPSILPQSMPIASVPPYSLQGIKRQGTHSPMVEGENPNNNPNFYSSDMLNAQKRTKV